ncbi:MAG: SDR family oxidoreductase [Rhodoluna sp.]|nr:SDR family oxidoreductase [Rhodoluna sp.]MBP6186372.1 SDR family oxidoreductase [Rhodoluna sp.]
MNEITEGLKPLITSAGKPALVLVTGATGYIGGRLVTHLLDVGYRVRVFSRQADRLRDYPWISKVEVVEGDANDVVALNAALKSVDIAYYMLHALNLTEDFEKEEQVLAEKFAKAALANKLKRIVYLGGIITKGQELSPHLASRALTGEILRNSGVPTIELRAGVVIGSGSASFEMLRYLTERLPIMTTPKWVLNQIQPIAIRDVLRYLVGAAAIDKKINGAFDVAGPDLFTYAEMMQQYAEAAGLRRRIIIPIPVLTPKLSSGWVGLVTPVPFQLARRLVDSLKNDVIADNGPIRELIADPKSGLTPFKTAVKLALTRLKTSSVETRWTDASVPYAPSDPLPTDPDWAGGSLYTDVRTVESTQTAEQVFARIEAIGGDHGYSTATWAWQLRGLMDRLVGGVGLRRGRRDPDHLVVGEALDFWRVEEIKRPNLLRLRAEMKMPGRAWLEWSVIPNESGTGCTVVQRAIYVPLGLWGHLYWWAVWPMHGLVFPSMAKNAAFGKR